MTVALPVESLVKPRGHLMEAEVFNSLVQLFETHSYPRFGTDCIDGELFEHGKHTRTIKTQRAAERGREEEGKRVKCSIPWHVAW